MPLRAARHGLLDAWWVWSVPVGVFALVYLSPILELSQLVAGALGIALVVLLGRYPGPALVALVWLLPLQTPLFSFLFGHGVAAQQLRYAGAVKEALGLAVLVAAAGEVARGRSHLDRVDKLVLAYVGLLIVYLLLPMIVSSPGYPGSFGTRLLGFRLNAAFLLLFLACRHAPINGRWRQRFINSVVIVAAMLAGVGLYQFFRAASFTDIVVNDLGIPRFLVFVLNTPPSAVAQLLDWTRTRPVRVGSLFVGPFDFADSLLLPAGLLLDKLTRIGVRTRDVMAISLIGAALLASQTRANILALGVMTLLALSPAPQRVLASRLRLVAIIALGIIAFIPNLASTRLGGAAGSAASSQGHVDEIETGIRLLAEHPLGFGLGSAPGVSVRTEDAPIVISDNSILQVGNELGVVMMVLFGALLVAVILRLGRPDADDPSNHPCSGVRLGLIGLVLAGQLHHAFQAFAISWIVWAAAGLALSSRRDSNDASTTPSGSRRRSDRHE